jgi:hypothetical protein
MTRELGSVARLGSYEPFEPKQVPGNWSTRYSRSDRVDFRSAAEQGTREER